MSKSLCAREVLKFSLHVTFFVWSHDKKVHGQSPIHRLSQMKAKWLRIFCFTSIVHYDSGSQTTNRDDDRLLTVTQSEKKEIRRKIADLQHNVIACVLKLFKKWMREIETMNFAWNRKWKLKIISFLAICAIFILQSSHRAHWPLFNSSVLNTKLYLLPFQRLDTLAHSLVT